MGHKIEPRNWTSNPSVIKIKYTPFDAVFDALSESVIKKMEDIFLTPFSIELLPENPTILVAELQKTHFFQFKCAFKKNVLYTDR